MEKLLISSIKNSIYTLVNYNKIHYKKCKQIIGKGWNSWRNSDFVKEEKYHWWIEGCKV